MKLNLDDIDLSTLPKAKARELVDLFSRHDTAEEREQCEGQLLSFLEGAWPFVDSSEFQPSWAIEAMCDHLEAVCFGQITRLLINVPPRCTKTTLCSVVFPVWVWMRSKIEYLSGPQVKFLCASYSHALSLDASNRSRRLVESPWCQKLWPNKIEFRSDQNAKHNYETTAGGGRVATSVGGQLLGLGGDILICDDPNNTTDVESDAERETVGEFWKEFHSTRLNDPNRSALIVIQQRLHQKDVSGVILDSGEDWVHLCIPMRYDTSRRYVTVVLPQYEDGLPYDDPRDEEGQLMWPERFDEAAVTRLESQLGPYLAAGRLQQLPSPKGGGIIQDIWWRDWSQEAVRYGLEWKPEKQIREFPQMELVVGSIDTAYGEKEENDYSAMTVWGIWIDRNKNRRAMLMFAWAEHLRLHGEPPPAKLDQEPDEVYTARRSRGYGLVEKVAETCKRYSVQRLLIEDKTRGRDVANELRRLYTRDNWGVELIPVDRDKVARTHAVVPLFTDAAVWAPNTGWAQKVIDQCARFPKDDHDDLHDTVTQFLNWARHNALLARADEEEAERIEDATYKPRSKGITELYGLQ